MKSNKLSIYHHVYNFYVYSGATSQALKLTEELKKTCNSSIFFINTQKGKSNSSVDGRVINIGVNPVYKLLKLFLLLLFVVPRKSIHHVHGFHFLELLLLCFFRKKVFYKCTLKGQDDLDTIYRSTRFKFFVSFILKRISFVNSLNPIMKKINSNYIEDVRNVVVPNGVSLNDFVEDKSVEIGEDRYFIIVGAIVPRKNVLSCIAFFCENYLSLGYGLKIIGPHDRSLNEFSQDYYEEVKSYVERYSSGNIEFLGKIQSDLVNEYYSSCVAMLFNSKTEGTPNVVLEAMSFNCPVIYNLRDETVEWLIGDNKADLLKSDFESMVPSIGYLDEIRSSGYLHERARSFSIQETANQTLKLYQEMV